MLLQSMPAGLTTPASSRPGPTPLDWPITPSGPAPRASTPGAGASLPNRGMYSASFPRTPQFPAFSPRPSLGTGGVPKTPGPSDLSRGFLRAPTASLSAGDPAALGPTALGMPLPAGAGFSGPAPSLFDPRPRPGPGLAATLSMSDSSGTLPSFGRMGEPAGSSLALPSFGGGDLGTVALSLPTEKDQDQELRCWVTVFGFPPDLVSYIVGRFSEYGKVVRHQPPPMAANYVHLRYSREFEAQTALAQPHRRLNDALIVGVFQCTERGVLGPRSAAAGDRSTTVSAAPAPDAPSALARMDPFERPVKRLRTDLWGQGWGRVFDLFFGAS